VGNDYADIKKDYKTVFVMTIFLLAFMVISGFLLTAGRGLDDNTFVLRFIIYSILGGTGLLFMFVVSLYNYINHTRTLKTIVHDPEEGILKIKAVYNPVLLFLMTLILFTLPLFFLGKFSNTFLSGVPFKVQQITTFANIWADSVFPALAENLFIFILLALVYTWNFKKNYKRNGVMFYSINLIFLPLLFAFLWMFFHLKVYGSNEIALLSTFVFGFIGILLTMSTMSFIPFAVLHFLTNFMLSIKRYNLMSSDLVLVTMIVAEFLFIIAFVLVYRFDKKKYARG